MSDDIPDDYDPDRIEARWREAWTDTDLYRYTGDRPVDRPMESDAEGTAAGPDETATGDGTDDAPTDYVIDTPPPYPTGNLHIGNALGWCYMDFAARFHRLRGRDVSFPQGWDCHGLPTEVKVEENHDIHRTDVPRDEFRALCEEHTEEQIEAMRETMHRLGFSQDWSQEYRTMDPEYWGKTQRSFVAMHDADQVYRDEHPVNWCPRCETAIADAEVETAEGVDGTLYYITFPGVDNDDIEIATTRPELLAACVSMAVDPEDDRYADRIGDTFEVPLFGQEIELIADDAVDGDFGTGAVMICTFGDKQDVEWWAGYDLELREAFTPDGRLTDIAGEYAGLEIDAAKEAIVDDLDAAGLLTDSEPTEQSVGQCWRCDTPIEILSTDQWFVRVDTDAVLERGREVDWIPPHMYDRLEEWAEGMEWDWVISRQRVFATPFPVWYCGDCGGPYVASEAELPVDPTAAEADPAVDACPSCGTSGPDLWEPETDVMDTWMDSSITALHAGGWPAVSGDAFTPVALREQGHDIIRTWAFYTILRTDALADEIPWAEALINGMVFGDDGHKMSKSRGNFVQPEAVVEEHSADAFRQAIALGGRPGSDIQFQWKEVTSAGRFCTKVWNIARFASEHVDDRTPTIEAPGYRDADRWILTECGRTIDRVAEHMAAYRFDDALRELREFVWHDLADDYLELIKRRLYEGRPGEARAARHALFTVLSASIRALSPFAPFITAELWDHLPTDGSVHAADWPTIAVDDDRALQAGRIIADTASAVRAWKSDAGMALNAECEEVAVYLDDDADREALREEPIDIYDLSGAVNAAVRIERGDPEVELVPVDVEVDHSIIGPEFRERSGAVAAAIEEMDPAEIARQRDRNGEIEVPVDGEVVIVAGDAVAVEEEQQAASGEAVAVLETDHGTVVVTP